MKILVRKLQIPQIYSSYLIDSTYRNFVINCSISSRELTKNLVRVRSSNLWGITINVKDRKAKTGDMIIQFKGKDGGPDGVYMYFDVPMMVYRRFQSAPSKGHYFWQYIRNNYKYRKLSGDKKGKLPNAIN